MLEVLILSDTRKTLWYLIDSGDRCLNYLKSKSESEIWKWLSPIPVLTRVINVMATCGLIWLRYKCQCSMTKTLNKIFALHSTNHNEKRDKKCELVLGRYWNSAHIQCGRLWWYTYLNMIRHSFCYKLLIWTVRGLG